MATDLRLRETIPDIAERLMETYAECLPIHHLDHGKLPARRATLRILDCLFEVLYPGFGDRQNLHMSNVVFHAGSLLTDLHDTLTTQISRALRVDRERRLGHPCDGIDEHGEPVDDDRVGQRRAVDFLERLPDIRRVLADDAQACLDGDPACTGLDEAVMAYPGLEAVTIFRVAHALHRLGVPLLPRIMTEHAHRSTGIDIHPAAVIGRSFFIDHGTGVVVGGTCVIGDHVKLYQGVTLGALSFPKDAAGALIRDTKRHPTIGDHVVIYANATVLGGATEVGEHSVVGSSVWLTESVPPYSMVTLEKPKLRIRGGQTPA